MEENLSSELTQIISLAGREALAFGSPSIKSEHILLAFLLSKLCASPGLPPVTGEDLIQRFEAMTGTKRQAVAVARNAQQNHDESATRVLSFAGRMAKEAGTKVELFHLLAVLAVDAPTQELLMRLGADLKTLKASLPEYALENLQNSPRKLSIEELHKQTATWENRAKMAIQMGQHDLADEALKNKLKYQKQLLEQTTDLES